MNRGCPFVSDLRHTVSLFPYSHPVKTGYKFYATGRVAFACPREHVTKTEDETVEIIVSGGYIHRASSA
jgi:hypothetical protein